MPRGRIARHPATRNLELYHEYAWEGRPQMHLASRYRLSQPRATQICRRVRQWVDTMLASAAPDSGACNATAGVRLHLAVMIRRKQLADAYRPYLDRLGGSARVVTWQHLQFAADAGLLPAACFPQLPPRESVAAALEMIRELDDLRRVAELGPFAGRDQPLAAGPLAPGKRAPAEFTRENETPLNEMAAV